MALPVCRTQIILVLAAIVGLASLCDAYAFELPPDVTQVLTKYEEVSPRTASMMNYSIFRGTSSLRDLPPKEQGWIETYGKSASSLLLFLTPKHVDAAHEVILGVTPSNVLDAEYAATHPGSGWTQRHALSTLDDWIHSIIHRDGEGSAKGEGNHTGWENARHWAAGGPKTCCDGLPPLCTHPVAQRLAKEAPLCAPLCCQRSVVVPLDSASTHSVLADGGKRRTVCVSPGLWDPFCFITLLESNDLELQDELEHLRRLERRFLLEHCLRQNEVDQS